MKREKIDVVEKQAIHAIPVIWSRHKTAGRECILDIPGTQTGVDELTHRIKSQTEFNHQQNISISNHARQSSTSIASRRSRAMRSTRFNTNV